MKKETIDLADSAEALVFFSDDYKDTISQENILDILKNNEECSSNISETKITSIRTKIEDCWQHLKYRKTIIPNYPFLVDSKTLTKKIENGKKHIPYIFVLACAEHQKIFNGHHDIAKDFEELCKLALISIFPKWKIKNFAANSCDRKKFWGTGIADALEKLKKELKGDTAKPIEGNHTGDCGIDIIGWVPFKDKGPNPAFFCQCTISKEWRGKTSEADAKYFPYLNFNDKPHNICFIPYWLSEANGHWPPISGCTLIDRSRLIWILSNPGFLRNNKNFLNKAISTINGVSHENS